MFMQKTWYTVWLCTLLLQRCENRLIPNFLDDYSDNESLNLYIQVCRLCCNYLLLTVMFVLIFCIYVIDIDNFIALCNAVLQEILKNPESKIQNPDLGQIWKQKLLMNKRQTHINCNYFGYIFKITSKFVKYVLEIENSEAKIHNPDSRFESNLENRNFHEQNSILM